MTQIDEVILREIRLRPGTTIDQIVNKLRLPREQISERLDQLVSAGAVTKGDFLFLEEGMIFSRYFLAGVRVAEGYCLRIAAVESNPQRWSNEGFLYALTRNSFVISNKPVDAWQKEAMACVKARILRSQEGLDFILPDSIRRFYWLDASEITISPTDDTLHVLLGRTFIPLEGS